MSKVFIIMETYMIRICLECVARKYPRAPETAFANARDAANQYGLDQKVRHGVESAAKIIRDKAIADNNAEENENEET